jgi:hypothetical protein
LTFTSVQIKGTIPRINKKFVEYRSFKNFDQEFFLNDLEQKNLNSIVDKCDNVNSAYENFESEFISVINKHAPMKKKKPVDKPVPFMNKYEEIVKCFSYFCLVIYNIIVFTQNYVFSKMRAFIR